MINNKVKFKGYDPDLNRLYECPVCGQGTVKVPDNLFFGRCDDCSATMFDYKPLGHQEAFHKSNVQYRLNIGGFGSGKTTAACIEIVAHALTTPNGRSLITAPTLQQFKDAVMPELNRMIPPWFLETSRGSPTPYFKFKNGHEIIVYASSNGTAIRSLNLTAFYIEEASGVSYDIFDTLMSRLRNHAGVIRDDFGNEIGYKYMGIISTNPEDGWIKDKFLLLSSKLYGSESIDLLAYEKLMAKKTERHFNTFISSTRDNKFLPREFIERTCAGKDVRWIRKYIDCILDIKEGAVYPEFLENTVEPFDIPNSWPRIAGYDPGFADGVGFPVGAINPKTGVIYVYHDYYEQERPISYHAEHVRKTLQGKRLLFPVQADPSVRKRNDRDGINYGDYFGKLSKVYLEPAKNDIMFGIEKVRDYFHSGKLKIFNNCLNLIFEAQNYVYKKTSNGTTDTPIDAFNHLLDALRYMIVRLPRDPNDVNSVFLKGDLINKGSFKANVKKDDFDFFKEKTVYGGFKL